MRMLQRLRFAQSIRFTSAVVCLFLMAACTRNSNNSALDDAKKKAGEGDNGGAGATLQLSPTDPTIAVKNSISFQVAGGEAPYYFYVGEGGNGTIDLRSGNYMASERPGGTKIRVRDSKGNFGETYVTIKPALQFGITARNVGVNESLKITPQNGVEPYSFSILEGSGSIDARTGELKAPNKPGKMKVRISDSRGNYAEAEFGAVLTNRVALGLKHTCALLEDGTVKCWGGNRFGQLGIGNRVSNGTPVDENPTNLPAVLLGTVDGQATGRPMKAISVVSGRNHSCALLENNRVKCWGRNFYGNLGIGSRSRQGDSGSTLGPEGNSLLAVDLGVDSAGNPRKALGLAAGKNFTCALMDNQRIKCWGSNFFGQLGLGKTDWMWGDKKSEMGEKLPDLDLGKNLVTQLPLKAIGLSAGRHHACALIEDGRVKCWGKNFWGQLGIGTHEGHGRRAGDLGDALPYVNLGTGRTATQIAVGNYFSCALLDNAQVKCWGSNMFGQAAAGGGFWPWNKPWVGVNADEMGDNLKAVDLGTSSGQTPVRVRHLSAGDQHVCVITETRTIKCWGRNAKGQLGIADQKNRGRDLSKMGNQLPELNFLNEGLPTQMGLGRRHSCAILDDRNLKCWPGNSEMSSPANYEKALSLLEDDLEIDEEEGSVDLDEAEEEFENIS